MRFSSPGLLWTLPLALAPLLLHFLSRRRSRVVRFSDTALLREVHLRSLPRRRLREYLLVVSRCTILAFLLLVTAGPSVETSGGASATSAGEGLDVIVLLDASYSMGYGSEGRSRFELARQAGRAILRGLKSGDRAAVGLFSDRLEEPAGAWAWQTAAEAISRLDAARLGFRGTDYAPAVKSAVEFLAGGPQRRRAVVLLSDGARHGLRAPLELEPGIELLSLSWPEEASNAYLTGIRLLPEGGGRPERLGAVLRVSGVSRARSSLELWLGGRRSAIRDVEIKNASEETVEFPLPPPADARAPAWSGRLALRPDSLSADDLLYYSFSRKRRPRLLCLHGGSDFFKAPRTGYFLKKLFGGAQDSLLDFDADFIDLTRQEEARLSDYDAVVLADVKEIPAASAAALDVYLRKGGGLLVLPGAASSAKGFGAIETWLPARLGAVTEPRQPQGLAAAGGLRWEGFELDRIWIGRRHELAPKSGSSVLLKGKDGSALLVVGEKGEARVALWASSLDLSWSNLALKPLFAVWAEGVLREISRRDPGARSALNLRVGEPIRRVWGAKEAAPARVSLRGPDGRSLSLWVKDRRVEYARTSAPGLYTLDDELGGSRVYAVNLDRSSESDLAPAPEAPWRKLRAESALQDLIRILYGRDARPGVLAATAAFLALEMLLSLPFLRFFKGAAAGAAVLLALAPAASRAQAQGDRFVWTQLQLGSDWDPYPDVAAEALDFLSTVTSVLSAPAKRVVSLRDEALFSTPLLVLAGRSSPPPLSAEELENLRHYLMGGGMLWIEDVSGSPAGGFDRWTRKTLASLLPEGELAALSPDHVVYKTFFLLRAPAGRVMVRGFLEGIHWGSRLAVIYSRNDLLGAWAKDALGRPLHRCVPGGEPQRHNARKLTLNILMYSLTGSYKSDAVHQPFLMQKIRSGIP